MSKLPLHLLFHQTSILALLLGSCAGIIGLTSNQAIAEDGQPNRISQSDITLSDPASDAAPGNDASPASDTPTDTSGMDQVTSVSQLTDVKPSDWAFQALQSLVERYGCIVGYPDRTFRGNRALTRYEFAAGLNACLDRVNELITAGTADLVRKEDLVAIQRLQEQFAVELATLRGRIDALDVRNATLDKQQFSTTTKLVGEAILSRSDALGGESVLGFGRVPTSVNQAGNAVFQNRVRLDFLTSFTGKDLLVTRLEAGNAVPILASGGVTGGANSSYLLFSNEGRLAYDNSTVATSNNSVNIGLLSYTFSLGNNLAFTVYGAGGSHFYYADTINPYLDDKDGGNGALSRFGQHNPIYRIGGNGAGLGVNVKLNDVFRFDVGYLANQAFNSGADQGLFNGNYSALAQVVVQPFDRFKLGLTYVRSYDRSGDFRFGAAGTATGTFLANLLPGSQEGVFPPSRPVTANSYGVEVSFAISPRFVIGGWAGLTKANLIGFGDADIWNYAGTIVLPDFLRKGSVAAIIVGSEPTLKGVEVGGSQRTVLDRNDALHVEAMYKFQLVPNLSFTPGLIWLPAINQRSENDDVLIGVFRTTYSF